MDFPSNPGVDETVNVLGLKGQYIIFAAISVVAFIVIAAVLGSTDLPILLVILFLVGLVIVVLGGIIKINKRFGKHGLMKFFALKQLPCYVRHTVSIRHIVKKDSHA